MEKLGYSGHVSSLIKVSHENGCQKFFNQLIKIPNIIVAMRLLGPYNIDALIPFSTAPQLVSIKETISEIGDIEKVDYQIGESLV